MEPLSAGCCRYDIRTLWQFRHAGTKFRDGETKHGQLAPARWMLHGGHAPLNGNKVPLLGKGVGKCVDMLGHMPGTLRIS